MNRLVSVCLVAAVLCLGVGLSVASALDRGQRAAEIGLNSLAGNAVTLASLRGKVVIVDFWASWCAPCADEMPVLERLYRANHEAGLEVVGVAQDAQAANVTAFLRRVPVSFPIVVDNAHAVAGRYHPDRMPTSYIVDRHGVVRFVHSGFRSADAAVIEREVAQLLAEHP